MMDNINKRKLKLLITIVNRGKSELFTELYEQHEVNMQMVCLGKGTANSEILDFFGLAETEKDVILSIVSEDKVPLILDILQKQFSISKYGKGIAFTIPFTSTIGISVYRFLSNTRDNVNGKRVKEVKRMTNKQQFELVICVVNDGYSDVVMTSAKGAGAKGGTIMHARGTAHGGAENFFGITIQPEKELVLIVVPTEIKDAVLHAIYHDVGLETRGHGIAFCLPVDDIVGIFTKEKEEA